MGESRQRALERWLVEKRRQKDYKSRKATATSHSTCHAVSQRTAQVTLRGMMKARKSRKASPASVTIESSRPSEMAPLGPFVESEKAQMELYNTPAETNSEEILEEELLVAGQTLNRFEVSKRKKRQRRRSYISPSLHAPSLAGGAQRVQIPTQLYKHESDDFHIESDDTILRIKPEIDMGSRRVSVLALQSKSEEFEESTSLQLIEEPVFSKKTVSLDSISTTFRVPHLISRQIKSEPTMKQRKAFPLREKEEIHQECYADMNFFHDGKCTCADIKELRTDRNLFLFEKIDVCSCLQAKAISIERPLLRSSHEDINFSRSFCKKESENIKWGMDDFIVTKNLGQGKFGNVYLAKVKSLNVSVALKVLFKSPLTRDSGVSNLKREVEIQARLCHPNILRMHGYFYDDSCVYLVLEYAPYGELYKKLAKEKYFSSDVAAHYVAQVVEALKYCHSCNVIHRDIKPENLLLGCNRSIKLADFGWSVHAPKPHNLRKTFCGTPDYLSPEMVAGEPYDHRTDSWSLGVLTYELLIGSTPFHCINQMEMYKRIALADYHFPPIPLVSESAKKFISGLLKRKPSDRMSLEDASKHPWIVDVVAIIKKAVVGYQ